MTALENEILEIINEVTECCYTGRLSVMQEDDGYTLRLGLNTPNAPTVLYYQGSVEDFKKYVPNLPDIDMDDVKEYFLKKEKSELVRLGIITEFC